jgi:hypothetical protein
MYYNASVLLQNLLEKGDLEVLVEQRDFLRSMLEQQEAVSNID